MTVVSLKQSNPPEPVAPALPVTSTIITPAPEVVAAQQRRERDRRIALALAPPVIGLALFVLLWAMVSQNSALPGPVPTFEAAVKLFAHPFYDNGPNDQGIGWNVLSSMSRVGMGFGLAVLIGVPAGFAIGRFTFLNRMTAPIVSLLRPV